MMAASSSSLSYKIFSRFSNHNYTNKLSVSRDPALLNFRSRSSPITYARKNKKSSSSLTAKEASSSKSKKAQPEMMGDEDIDEDAIEALFNFLEEDLKNDMPEYNNDEEITEEDLAKLEQELAEALGDVDIDEVDANNIEESDEEEEEDRLPKLKNWQIKRLAYALKVGRRKTSIKSLAAELCLDRSFVLDILRDPPPQLLLMSANLPDIAKETSSKTEIEAVEPTHVLTDVVEESDGEIKLVKEPVHEKQTRWSMQKRLKKVHVQTLERVYSRTKRPTNSMISSIVHVTNLPWKRVVKWFEDKRIEEGIPEKHLPFRRRSKPEKITA